MNTVWIKVFTVQHLSRHHMHKAAGLKGFKSISSSRTGCHGVASVFMRTAFWVWTGTRVSCKSGTTAVRFGPWTLALNLGLVDELSLQSSFYYTVSHRSPNTKLRWQQIIDHDTSCARTCSYPFRQKWMSFANVLVNISEAKRNKWMWKCRMFVFFFCFFLLGPYSVLK